MQIETIGCNWWTVKSSLKPEIVFPLLYTNKGHKRKKEVTDKLLTVTSPDISLCKDIKDRGHTQPIIINTGTGVTCHSWLWLWHTNCCFPFATAAILCLPLHTKCKYPECPKYFWVMSLAVHSSCLRQPLLNCANKVIGTLDPMALATWKIYPRRKHFKVTRSLPLPHVKCTINGVNCESMFFHSSGQSNMVSWTQLAVYSYFVIECHLIHTHVTQTAKGTNWYSPRATTTNNSNSSKLLATNDSVNRQMQSVVTGAMAKTTKIKSKTHSISVTAFFLLPRSMQEPPNG